jgi:hypothetical protein
MPPLPPSKPTIYGERYRSPRNNILANFIANDLPYLDYKNTLEAYKILEVRMSDQDRALLGCNDRYYLLTTLCGRVDALHPWLFARCREVEADPDNHLDLWARYHYKSTICTFAGIIQEILRDPEITCCILSATQDIANAFLLQIQQEFERNENLKRIYSDVLWADPRRDASRWSRDKGIVVKRKGNPKEATLECTGLIDGQKISRHYRLLDYDDVITPEMVTSPERIRLVTERWELSDNLGTHGETRKWHQGTRYAFGDTYGVIIERGILKERIHAATDDGTLDGEPVLLSPERWEQVKDAQRSTVNAQMLLNPLAGNEAVFRAEWLQGFEIRPTILNIYIMVDPSKGATKRSDRTAMAVIGVDIAGNRYLLDGVRHRMRLTERWETLKKLYEKWHTATGVQICIVGYERYGAQTEDEVIKLWQERDGVSFEMIELAWPREGGHSKVDRISRLEPEIRRGTFKFPAIVYHPERGGVGGLAYWSVWTPAQDKAVRDRGETPKHKVGQIVYRPYQGPTKQQLTCEKTAQGYRIQTAIKKIDEDRNVYDLTRCFIEEMVFFPFLSHDDLIDVVSRIYDMEPRPAVLLESEHSEVPVHPDT